MRSLRPAQRIFQFSQPALRLSPGNRLSSQRPSGRASNPPRQPIAADGGLAHFFTPIGPPSPQPTKLLIRHLVRGLAPGIFRGRAGIVKPCFRAFRSPHQALSLWAWPGRLGAFRGRPSMMPRRNFYFASASGKPREIARSKPPNLPVVDVSDHPPRA